MVTELIIKPANPTVVALNNITLSCLRPEPVLHNTTTQKFLWHRVGGNISAKSIGQESSRLTIPNVVPEDEGQYYCESERHDIHCAVSNRVYLRVDGEETYN